MGGSGDNEWGDGEGGRLAMGLGTDSYSLFIAVAVGIVAYDEFEYCWALLWPLKPSRVDRMVVGLVGRYSL